MQSAGKRKTRLIRAPIHFSLRLLRHFSLHISRCCVQFQSINQASTSSAASRQLLQYRPSLFQGNILAVDGGDVSTGPSADPPPCVHSRSDDDPPPPPDRAIYQLANFYIRRAYIFIYRRSARNGGHAMEKKKENSSKPPRRFRDSRANR